MLSIKLKFRKPKNTNKSGALYFQIIYNRSIKQVKINCRIFEHEWDPKNSIIIQKGAVSSQRNYELSQIKEQIKWEYERLCHIIREYQNTCPYIDIDNIIKKYKEKRTDKTTVFEYIRMQIKRLNELGRLRTSDIYKQVLSSLIGYCNNIDLDFDSLDEYFIESYESSMRNRGLCRNSTSFYMRALRSIYNKAVDDGLVLQSAPFKHVYTGVDKTTKRAISMREIKLIKQLDLSYNSALEFARDIFLFSFYLRGISFIDISYLKKSNLGNGYFTYNRKKTGQQLVVRAEKLMHEIVEKYPNEKTQYLFPIIISEDGTERKQYLNKLVSVNRNLKKIGKMIKSSIPLSMYVARHSWASIAKSKNVSLSVISAGMGHDSETTTQIYLASIQTSQIDDANRKLLKEL